MSEKLQALAKLREPFPSHQISKLNKGKGVVLDYVGHAALTSRLLDVDPLWSWEPLALTAQGLPLFDETGGLWIRLHICGMSRLGYGHAQKKSEPGAREKEVIGDALRNAAMRFGAALDLWHKGGDLGQGDDGDADEKPAADDGPKVRAKELLKMFELAKTEAEVADVTAILKKEWSDLSGVPHLADAVTAQRRSAIERIKGAK